MSVFGLCVTSRRILPSVSFVFVCFVVWIWNLLLCHKLRFGVTIVTSQLAVSVKNDWLELHRGD